MNNMPLNEDLRVFVAVARKTSFNAVAQEFGVSAGYVSKRIRVLEESLGTKLLHRSTRRVSITEEGERVFHWALRVLDDLDQLIQEVSTAQGEPRGLLRICSSFGFGHKVVAPLISQMTAAHPGLSVRFEMFDRIVDIASEGFDLDVRIGDEIAPHLIARKLAANRRILCAAPAYLAHRGTPKTLEDLARHDCLVIKERDHPFGVWRLKNGATTASVKVTGPLSTNHGEVAMEWCVDGRGILLRSLWDVGAQLQSGALVQVLPQWDQEANVWAVYPNRLNRSAKVRTCVEFLAAHLAAMDEGRAGSS